MLGDLRDWLAGFDAPRHARPLVPAADAVNRRQLRRCWVDVSYRTDLGPTEALAALAGRDVPAWQRNGLGELRGSDGRFMLRLARSARPFPLGLNAVGRVRPDPSGTVIEAQVGRSGGDLPIVVLPVLTAFVLLLVILAVLGGDGVPWATVAMVPLAAVAFVGARLLGTEGDDAIAILHERVPPMLVQPQPLPVAEPDRTGEPGQVRRALVAATSRQERVEVATSLAPSAVRDVLRAHIKASRRRKVAAPWDGTALKGRASRRRFELYVPGGDGGEELGSPRVAGSIEAAAAGGSVLHLRVGRAPGPARALLGLAVIAGAGALTCVGAGLVLRDSDWIGSAVLLAMFGGAFGAAVLATGWREDDGPDPLAAVIELVDGTLVEPPTPPAPPPPPPLPLVSPYRR